MRLASFQTLSALLAVTALAGCAASPSSEPDGRSASEEALTSTSDLLTIARRVAWADKGNLNPSFQVGTNGTLVIKDIDRDGAAGFHAYRTTWSEDAVPSYDVVADFQPVLVVKVKDCSTCTSITVGTKRADGKFEIKQAQPKEGTMEGPTLGDSSEFEHEVFITSVANLEASSDPHRVGKAVTNGSYNIINDNLE
jgi:hypothetical protein